MPNDPSVAEMATLTIADRLGDSCKLRHIPTPCVTFWMISRKFARILKN